ncbi:MAG: helix-turn-helix domain-containing protein [Marmoricola sp.]
MPAGRLPAAQCERLSSQDAQQPRQSAAQKVSSPESQKPGRSTTDKDRDARGEQSSWHWPYDDRPERSPRSGALCHSGWGCAPVSIESLAAELDLHPNTVRFHTSALEDAGLIEQGREQTGNKGRPRAVFVPTTEGARTGARNYQLLAAVLVDHLAQMSPEPLPLARSAGRSREALHLRADPSSSISLQVRWTALLEEMGFEPEEAQAPAKADRVAQLPVPRVGRRASARGLCDSPRPSRRTSGVM